jgi:hypothetical protein
MSFFNICEEFFKQINPQHYTDDEDNVTQVFDIPESFTIQRDLNIDNNLDFNDYVLESKFEICAKTLAEWLGHCAIEKKD